MAWFDCYTKLNISTNKPDKTLFYSITAHTVEKIMEMNGWTEDVAMERFVGSKIYSYMEFVQ